METAMKFATLLTLLSLGACGNPIPTADYPELCQNTCFRDDLTDDNCSEEVDDCLRLCAELTDDTDSPTAVCLAESITPPKYVDETNPVCEVATVSDQDCEDSDDDSEA